MQAAGHLSGGFVCLVLSLTAHHSAPPVSIAVLSRVSFAMQDY